MIGRRQFITLFGSAAARPLAARAQPAAMPVIGWLSAASPTVKPWPQLTAAFRQGLQDAGFVEGKNVTIEYRWAEYDDNRLPGLAGDLIQRRVAVIVATPRAHDVAKAMTSTIPIVFSSGSDPLRLGLVTSLNRPGGNLTGVTVFAGDLNGKRFGLLHDLVPRAAVMGILQDSTISASQFAVEGAQAAARSLGVQTRLIAAGNESEIEAAFAAFAREGVVALHTTNGPLLYGLHDRLARLAIRHRISASAEQRNFVEAGGLMSYGSHEPEALRNAGRYAGRILRGEKPGDLPVMLPTKFEFTINLKTAKALDLTIPAMLLASADEVIE
jgi:putative ABC transport system substrate-binding protein